MRRTSSRMRFISRERSLRTIEVKLASASTERTLPFTIEASCEFAETSPLLLYVGDDFGEDRSSWGEPVSTGDGCTSDGGNSS